MKKNLQDEDSTNKPNLNFLLDEEYLIQLDTDKPDSTSVYQLLRLNIRRQPKVVVQSIDKSNQDEVIKSLKKTECFPAEEQVIKYFIVNYLTSQIIIFIV